MKLIDYKKIELLTFTPKYLEEYLLFYRYNCPTVTFHAIKLFVLHAKHDVRNYTKLLSIHMFEVQMEWIKSTIL